MYVFTRLGAFFSILGLLAAAPGGATPLNLPSPEPDVFSGSIQVDYDAMTDMLTAVGTAFSFTATMGGTQDPITGGSFDLSATIDAAGVASSAMLSIMGSVNGFGMNLLTGTLAAPVSFGFPEAADAAMGADTLEFIFDVTGGDLAPLYGPQAFVILTGTGLDGNLFSTSFSNNGLGLSDTALPEPSTVLLVLTGMLGLSHYGRSRARRREGL